MLRWTPASVEIVVAIGLEVVVAAVVAIEYKKVAELVEGLVKEAVVKAVGQATFAAKDCLLLMTGDPCGEIVELVAAAAIVVVEARIDVGWCP
jgi:hypothetical protein